MEHIETIKLGVIGGSGLYHMEGLEDIESHDIQTPFGKPSALLSTGELYGMEIMFLQSYLTDTKPSCILIKPVHFIRCT